VRKFTKLEVHLVLDRVGIWSDILLVGSWINFCDSIFGGCNLGVLSLNVSKGVFIARVQKGIVKMGYAAGTVLLGAI